jgi:hypothetical protein
MRRKGQGKGGEEKRGEESRGEGRGERGEERDDLRGCTWGRPATPITRTFSPVPGGRGSPAALEVTIFASLQLPDLGLAAAG